MTAPLSELPAAVERNGLKPPALFVIGPTVRHAEKLDWFSRQPLAAARLVVAEGDLALAGTLEAAGAEVIAVPLPLTPASRVVLGAAPISGCVLRTPAEVDALDEERDGVGWEEEPVAWCLGPETAARARERGWQRVRQSARGDNPANLVDWIGSPAGRHS